MPTIVHVIITGIVSLIPVPQANGGGYIVRLQDARGAGAEHHPSLMVARESISGRSLPRPRASEILDDGEGLEVAAWTMPQNGLIRVVNKIRDGAVETDMPHVLEIEHGCGKVKDCPVPKPANAYAHVDLRITQGTIVTTNATDEEWRFDNEAESAQRPLAQELCWTFTIDESVLDLELPGIGTVAIAPLQTSRAIELRLQNTLLADLIPSKSLVPPEEDHHVELYFQLSKNPPEPPRYLVSKKEAESVTLPPHPVHELDGDAVAARREPFTEDQVECDCEGEEHADPDAHAGGLSAIRINCPPALWK